MGSTEPLRGSQAHHLTLKTKWFVDQKIVWRKNILNVHKKAWRQQPFWRQQFFDVNSFLTSAICLTSKLFLTSTTFLTSRSFGRQQKYVDVFDVNNSLTSIFFLTSAIAWRQKNIDVNNLFDVKKFDVNKFDVENAFDVKTCLTAKHFDVKNIFDVNTNLTSKKLLTSKKFGRQNSFWTSDFFPKLFCKDWMRLLRSYLRSHLRRPLLQRLPTRNSTRSTPWCSQILPLLLEP